MADGKLSPEAQEALERAMDREKSGKPRLPVEDWVPQGSVGKQVQSDDRNLPTGTLKTREEAVYTGLSEELSEERRRKAIAAGQQERESPLVTGPEKKKQSWLSKLLWGGKK